MDGEKCTIVWLRNVRSKKYNTTLKIEISKFKKNKKLYKEE